MQDTHCALAAPKGLASLPGRVVGPVRTHLVLDAHAVLTIRVHRPDGLATLVRELSVLQLLDQLLSLLQDPTGTALVLVGSLDLSVVVPPAALLTTSTRTVHKVHVDEELGHFLSPSVVFLV
jgi:hypothetical protein